jgi:predicted ATPase
MSKIRIKNFGPIKEGYLEDDGFLEIKKVTIFIGNQGSGKSTVAKVISTMMWLEKNIVRGTLMNENQKDIAGLFYYYGIYNYLKYDTTLYYDSNINPPIVLTSTEKNSAPLKKDNEKYVLPKIMYVPAERNTLSLFRNTVGLPKHLLTFYEELRNANRKLKSKKINLPINDYKYEYDESLDYTYIIGSDYRINLSNASSGVQSLAPLYIVSKNLAELVTQSDETIRENMNAESISRLNEEMRELEANDSISESEKVIRRKEIRAKYLPKCFINIVEEPEQNLYPTSQRHILNSLLEFNNQSEGNKLIMTTHSPYILSYLTLAIKGQLVFEKIKSLPGAEGLIEKLNEIVPVKSLVNPDDVAIYQLDDAGNITKLDNYKGLPSDENLLNDGLEWTNILFSQLLDLEETCPIL